jgi:hypothetical protein
MSNINIIKDNNMRILAKWNIIRLEGWGELEDDTNHGEGLTDCLGEPERVENVTESRLDKPVVVDII